MDPRDLVRYNHACRRRFAEFFVESLPWAELSKPRGSSHESIANVFMHGANMEDWWLHCLLPGRPWDGPAWDGFTSAEAMLKRVEEVEAKSARLLDGLSEADLASERAIDAGDGPRRMRLADVLVEATMEDVVHRGEIHAMLWQMDVEPPYLSWADWRASSARKP